MKGKRIIYILPIVVVALVAVIVFGRREETATFQHDSDFVFGTMYNITYESDVNLKKGIDSVLQVVDNSLSPFNEKSVITKVNNNEEVEMDDDFRFVVALAGDIYKDTDGAFDITVAPLVNAWGFGFKHNTKPTKEAIDSIMAIVGFEKIQLTPEGGIEKADERVMLDCSAIAKGFGVDKVAQYLDSRGVKNYMVEIGGEIAVKGTNKDKALWRIGVTKPGDDSLSIDKELQAVLNISDIAMATSGNYRNFYYKDGKKYAHTIDPLTGYPVQHNILSATVLAPTCAQADAYATSFMVMGIERAQKILERHKELQAYLIYTDKNGAYKVWYSPNLKDKVVQK